MTNLKLGIPLEKICDQCLLGIHKEIHQEAGTLQNHPHGEAVVRGHFIRGQVDMMKLKPYHEKVVVEMKRRGMNHDSPFDYELDSSMTGNWFMEEINFQAVNGRCNDCVEVEI